MVYVLSVFLKTPFKLRLKVKSISNYLKHSKEPQSVIKKKKRIVELRKISVGEESKGLSGVHSPEVGLLPSRRVCALASLSLLYVCEAGKWGTILENLSQHHTLV